MEREKSKIEIYTMEAVRRERVSQKISQAMLAYGIGVSSAFIGQVETPKHRAHYNLRQINEIAKFLCVSPRKFLPESAIE